MATDPIPSSLFQSAVFDEYLDNARMHAGHYLRRLPDRHVAARAGRDELLSALRMPLPQHGDEGGEVIDLLAQQAERGAVACNSPRYFGFVVGGAYPVALAADWLVSTWDQNAGIYAISPLVSVVEEIAGQWLLDLFDLPRESGVGFVTGCQMANFTCLAAARHQMLRRAGWDVEADGLQGAPRLHVVASAESHVTIDVALRYLGLGTRSVHRVETDAQGRMNADRLRKVVASIEGPMIVCAQAGNVNTGAFDPLREVAEVVRERGAWLHVDGAFGLWARASESLRGLADGIELADSWATDAHKWLNVPYDCGVAIVRHAQDHRGHDFAGRLPDPDARRGTRRGGLGARVLASRARRSRIRDAARAGEGRRAGPDRRQLRTRPSDGRRAAHRRRRAGAQRRRAQPGAGAFRR